MVEAGDRPLVVVDVELGLLLGLLILLGLGLGLLLLAVFVDHLLLGLDNRLHQLYLLPNNVLILLHPGSHVPHHPNILLNPVKLIANQVIIVVVR